MTMGNNETIIKTDKSAYTFQMLIDDINEAGEHNNEQKANKNADREYGSKMIVANMLIKIANEHSSEEYSRDRLRISIEMKLNEDGFLSGYMFFVSQNPVFDYTWNYMRQCKKKYAEFLTDAVFFLKNVLADSNNIRDLLLRRNEVHIVFNDLIDVSSNKESTQLNGKILWENFHLLSTIGQSYYFCIKHKESTILSGMRNGQNDVITLAKAALKLLQAE